MSIQKSTLSFLKELGKNNDKAWFAEHKATYDQAHIDIKAFVAKVEAELGKTDELDKAKLFRIYRDVRFSKDKTPYKDYFSMSFSRATAYRRGGYYLSIRPGESMVGGGFYNPEPSDLALIRANIAHDAAPLRTILNDPKFKATFGDIQGEKLKTAPKGFDKDHPDLDLLQHKSFYVFKTFSDKEVTSPNFINDVSEVFATIRPYFDYMSDILTHDVNGISLID